MMTHLTVTCRKRDKLKFTTPKFGTYEWRERETDPSKEDYGHVKNHDLDISDAEYAPNGQYNIKHLRRVSVEPSQLTGLAKFLADHLNGSCWASIHGQNPCNPYQRPYALRITSRYTQRQIWVKCGRMSDELAAKFERCYGVEYPSLNFTLPIIEPDESGENYFNRVATELRNIDGLIDSIARVEISGNVFYL